MPKQDSRRDRDQQPAVPIPDKATIEHIIAQGDPEVLVKWAEDIGKAIARQVTSSQIRNIFGTARQIQLRWPNDPQAAYRDAVLLRPKLGYFAKRERGRGMEDLRRVLSPALEVMSQTKDPDEQRKRFNHFVDFFEAILAYHKAYGGN
jgi:CRISPR-associated protein Csm2